MARVACYEHVVLTIFENVDEERARIFYQFEKEESVCCAAYTDRTRIFEIEGPLGIYVLVSPGGSLDDKVAQVSGNTLKIEVKARQSIDLGKILLP